MTLEVITAGPMLTVQDAGRSGLRHMGVPLTGPLDADAMALANALVGNPSETAALEFAGPAGRFKVSQPILIAVAGAECPLRIDDRALATGQSHRLEPGQILTVGAPTTSVWAYLAVAGGIATPPVLGSRATSLRQGLGGLNGRPLQAGDVLPLGCTPTGRTPLRLRNPQDNVTLRREAGPIRVIPGPQADWFTAEVRAAFTSRDFIVSPRRDRMAMVLDGVKLPAVRGHDIISDATLPGSIQIPASRQPLVLLAEGPTTGGYPKIGTVAAVDLPRLAQMATGARFRMVWITRDAAEDLLLARRKMIRDLLADLIPAAQSSTNSAFLLSHDLVGGFHDPEEITRPHNTRSPAVR